MKKENSKSYLRASNDVIVSVKNLSKKYGEIQAVACLNFEIFRGEFFGLLGLNGAGKTTTIGMLTGLINPSEGKITIDGLDLLENPRKAKAKIGFVPQDFAFYSTLSSRDNLYFFGRIYGLRGRLLRQRTDEVLRMVELHNFSEHTVSTFSNGMKRRLNIAIGLIHEPQILILDEPTVGLDVHMRQEILENLKNLNKEGLTVLYTTHIMAEAQDFCHRVAIIDRGLMVTMDNPATLIGDSDKDIICVSFNRTFSQSQIAKIEQLASVRLLNANGTKVYLKTNETDHVIKEVLALAESSEIRINSLEILEPNLETAFLHLTGRSPIECQ